MVETKTNKIMSDKKRLFIIAHIYARIILNEYNGSYKRAFQLGMLKAKRILSC